MSAPTQTQPQPPATLPVASPSLASHFHDYVQRVRGGEMGALPGIGAIVILVIVFSSLSPRFINSYNFANLITEGAPRTIIAMGLVFVLLVGEIDLSAGFTSGLCGALMATLMIEHGTPWYLAVLVAIVTGVVIGIVLGTAVAKIGVPSFVVTLAAFLAFQGLLLLVVHQGQIIRVSNPVIVAVDTKPMYVWLGWTVLAASVAIYAFIQFRRAVVRKKRGLIADPLSLVTLRVAALLVLAGAATWALSIERSLNPARASLRGVPIIVVVILVLLVVLTFVLKRTTFGLHLYAVGGNAEAARRAGIPVDRLRIAAFAICSAVAAIGGVAEASFSSSVDANTGGSNVLLYAVGAAVIGGTSLFGGRGRVFDAVLGGIVVAIIDNGMTLLHKPAWLIYVVTGAVLLVAATVDALSRRRSSAAGLR